MSTVAGDVVQTTVRYQPLVSTMQANVGDYESVPSLPNFNLFTVFFMGPGALISLLAAMGLVAGRAPRTAAAPHLRPPTPSH